MIDKTEDETLEEMKKYVQIVMAQGKSVPPEAAPLIEEGLTKMLTQNYSRRSQGFRGK